MMIRQYMLKQFIESELLRYKKLYAKMEHRLKELPEGSLYLRYGKLFYYNKTGNKQKHILINDNASFAKEIKERRYIKIGLPVLKKKINLYNKILETDMFYDPKAFEKRLPSQYKGIDDLNIFLEGNVNLKEWLQSGHKNPIEYSEAHLTVGGIKCRSKSEALIGSCLESRGLLYICEPEIKTRHRKIYPDFAILLPNSGRIIYLEHFGKIDDPKYRISNFNKFAEYADVGIYVGINFFYTTETIDNPLTVPTINSIIDQILELDIC